jgi:3-oxocholest-4-en-26-oate---CoA ligase
VTLVADGSARSRLRLPGLDLNWSSIWDAIASADPDRIAVITDGAGFTYADMEGRAARFAGWLQRHGVGRGDRVGCLLYNRPEYLVAVYAAMKLGAVPVNLNYRYGEAELAHVLTLTRPSVVVTAASLAGRLAAARGDAAALLVTVAEDGVAAPADCTPFEEACAGPSGDESGRSGDDRILLLTGGTTGMPKAVEYRHSGVLDSQLASAYGTLGVDFPRTLDEVVAIAIDPAVAHPVTLPITPLMHAMAFFSAMNTWLTGGSIVFLNAPRFDPARTIDTIVSRGVTRLIIAGDAVAVPLVAELDRRPSQRLDPLSTVLSSGMPWADASKRSLLDRSAATLIDIVGASEGGPFAMSVVRGASDLPSRLRLLPGAVVVTEEGDELAPGAVGRGRLAYRGVMPDGYFDDPERTALVYSTLRGIRYLIPGDWAQQEADGSVTMLGRGDAVVNSGGENVFPGEVEGAIARHPAVADCVVFGVPDERWGEVLAAAVELRPGASLTASELQNHVGELLAGYKKPRRVLFGPLDRSPSGKVSLVELRARVLSAPNPS